MLHNLAYSVLPEVGQRAIINSGNALAKIVLANSPTTSQENIERLVADSDPLVRIYTYRRTQNIDVLRDILEEWGEEGTVWDSLVYASQNPSAPAHLLEKLLDSKDMALAFNAYTNPNTPEEARREMSPGRANWLTCSDDNETYQKMRVTELVLANPWMSEDPARWCHSVQHAIAESPYTSTEAGQTLATTIRCGIGCLSNAFWQSMTWCEKSTDTADNAVKQLIESAGDDIVAINRSDFTETSAIAILNRGIYWPTANVTGRLVNRFGGTILLKAESTREWQEHDDGESYLELCSMLAHTLWHGQHLDYAIHQNITEACAILGTSKENWTAYISLIQDWYSTYVEAARTVCKL